MSFTATEKRQCAARELAIREKVYVRWVKRGKMLQRIADREIALMKEIAEDYRKLEEKERLL